MLYVGVDAHKKTSHFTVMDESGKVLKRKNVTSDREGVANAIGRYRQPMKAVMESSYAWGPMYDLLEEVADEVLLAHPLKVKAIASARIKTDSIDSETLAHLLRADLIPEAYRASGRFSLFSFGMKLTILRDFRAQKSLRVIPVSCRLLTRVGTDSSTAA